MKHVKRLRIRSTSFREGERGELGVGRVHLQFMKPRESLIWAALIFVLCAADALLTLSHVRRGARELNPLMAYLIEIGPGAFVAVKVLLSLLALYSLVVYLPRFRHARMCFGTIGVIHFTVCCYHLTAFVAAPFLS